MKLYPVVGRPDMPESPNRISGAVCEGCRFEPRCREDSLCWRAEKADIAAENTKRKGWA